MTRFRCDVQGTSENLSPDVPRVLFNETQCSRLCTKIKNIHRQGTAAQNRKRNVKRTSSRESGDYFQCVSHDFWKETLKIGLSHPFLNTAKNQRILFYSRRLEHVKFSQARFRNADFVVELPFRLHILPVKPHDNGLKLL